MKYTAWHQAASGRCHAHKGARFGGRDFSQCECVVLCVCVCVNNKRPFPSGRRGCSPWKRGVASVESLMSDSIHRSRLGWPRAQWLLCNSSWGIVFRLPGPSSMAHLALSFFTRFLASFGPSFDAFVPVRSCVYAGAISFQPVPS